MLHTSPVFQSRWGYHPCAYADWLMIKRLRFLWYRTLRALAAWRRWNAKQPQNRVRWRRIRNAGRPIGWERLGPWPEPSLPPFMIEDKWGQRQLAHGWIGDLYRQARHPQPEPCPPVDEARLREVREFAGRLEEWFSRSCETLTE